MREYISPYILGIYNLPKLHISNVEFCGVDFAYRVSLFNLKVYATMLICFKCGVLESYRAEIVIFHSLTVDFASIFEKLHKKCGAVWGFGEFLLDGKVYIFRVKGYFNTPYQSKV